MTGPLQRRAIADGVWFSRIHDPKFYHNSISVTIITPLAEGKTSAAVLAAYLLRMGSRRCRDMTELECRLADLYGAVLDTDISRHGENQLLTFSIAGADDRFALEGESISRGCAELLGEILLEPKPSQRRPSGWSSSTLLIPLRRRSTINAATRPSAARLRWAGAVGLRCPATVRCRRRFLSHRRRPMAATGS